MSKPKDIVASYKDLPNCPAEFIRFIETTSMDSLVRWKLQSTIARLPTKELSGVLPHLLHLAQNSFFIATLMKANGKKIKAAEYLGCNRNTVARNLPPIIK